MHCGSDHVKRGCYLVPAAQTISVGRAEKDKKCQDSVRTSAVTQACSSLALRLAASLVFPTTCLEEREQLLTNCSFDERERGFQQDVKQVKVRRDACLLLCRQS